VKRAIYSIFSLLLVILFLACAVDQQVTKQPLAPEGSIIAQAEWPDDLSPDLVNVRMTVLSSDMEPKIKNFRFTDEPRMILGIHGVPAGENREVIIEGLNAGSSKLYAGSVADISVIPNEIVNSGVIVMDPVARKTTGIKAPSKVRALAGDGQITVKWNHVSDAESYSIYMNKKSGTSKKNFDARKATERNRYTWEELQNGKRYYFVVTAETASGESQESIEISVKPVATQKEISKSKKSKKTAQVKKKQEKTIQEETIAKAEAIKIAEEKSRANAEAEKKAEEEARAKVEAEEKAEEEARAKAEAEEKAEEQARAKAEAEKKAEEEARAKAEAEKKAEEEDRAKIESEKIAKAEVKTEVQLQKLTPKQILEEVDLIRAPNENFAVDMTITFQSGSKKSVNKMSLRVRDFSKSLVIYNYPATQKGRVLLMVESNMWIYFPGTKRAIRISPQQQLLGQVSNADVARAVFSLDYSAEKVEEEVVDNEDMLKITLKAKTEGAAYSNIQIWIKKDGFRPIKAEFFTLTGRLLKTIYYKGYKNVLGRQRPTVYEIHDAIKKSDKSIMEYTKWQIQDTPNRYFQKTFMQRVGSLN